MAHEDYIRLRFFYVSTSTLQPTFICVRQTLKHSITIIYITDFTHFSSYLLNLLSALKPPARRITKWTESGYGIQPWIRNRFIIAWIYEFECNETTPNFVFRKLCTYSDYFHAFAIGCPQISLTYLLLSHWHLVCKLIYEKRLVKRM